MVNQFISQLAHRFSLKDLEKLSYFLGIEILPNQHGFLLSQRRYLLDLLTRTHMTHAKPVSTPLQSGTNLSLYSGDALSDPTEFRSVVGSLQYLLLTRLDIAYAVNKLSQFMHQPTTEHWIHVKRLLRYLCGTPDHGLQLYNASPPSLHAFSDDLHAYSVLTGQVIQTTSHPQVHILFILVATLSPEAPKSRKPLHALPLRQNIGQLPTPLLNSIGYPHCYMILASHYQHVQSFTVTILGLLSCVPILFSTPE
jgi:hypothetical protein